MSEKYRLNPQNGFLAEKKDGHKYSDIVFTAVIMDPAMTANDLYDEIERFVKVEHIKRQIIVITNIELSDNSVKAKKEGKILIMTIEGLQRFLAERDMPKKEPQKEIVAVAVLLVLVLVGIIIANLPQQISITIVLSKGVSQILESEEHTKRSAQPSASEQIQNLSEVVDHYADKRRQEENPEVLPTDSNTSSAVETDRKGNAAEANTEGETEASSPDGNPVDPPPTEVPPDPPPTEVPPDPPPTEVPPVDPSESDINNWPHIN